MGNVSLKIVILYADRSSEELGKEVAESLRQKLGPAFHVRQSSWNSELLRSPKLRAMAALEAGESDLVIVSMDEGNPVSNEVQEWFGLWRERRAARPAALVALLKRDTAHTPHVIEETLHAFADESGMDFFCHSELRRNYPRFRINTPEMSHFASVS